VSGFVRFVRLHPDFASPFRNCRSASAEAPLCQPAAPPRRWRCSPVEVFAGNSAGHLRRWIRLSNNGAGRLGCGPRLEAKTQFARRLIIGFDGAETNHTRGEPVGPVRQVILDEWVSELKEISGCGDRRRRRCFFSRDPYLAGREVARPMRAVVHDLDAARLLHPGLRITCLSGSAGQKPQGWND
jgi:hypothetical protein